MFVLKLRNCRVCVNPVCAAVEVVIIFCLLQVLPSVAGRGLHVVDSLIISFLVFAGFLVSLFMHEYAHVLAARAMRLPANGITISVFGAYTSVDGKACTPKVALVALAGPFMNIVLGAFFYAGHIVFRQMDIAGTACFCLAVLNGIFSVYNLLPVMPLDGGFVVRAACCTASRDWWWSTRLSFNIGTGFLLIGIAAGIINILFNNLVTGIFFLILGISLLNHERLAYRQMSAERFLSMLDLKGHER
jgi:Zn-dependent protease